MVLNVFDADVTLQVDGVAKIHGLGKITPAEKVLVEAALPELSANIEKVCIFLSNSTPTKDIDIPGCRLRRGSQTLNYTAVMLEKSTCIKYCRNHKICRS
jgi:hypothetical protein